MATTKRKTATKSSKTKTIKSKPKTTGRIDLYATEHDFIIITGGGLLVMVLVTLFLFGVI